MTFDPNDWTDGSERPAVMITLILVLLAFLLLSGCATTGNSLNPTQPSSVCEALVGPIKYNSTNPKSPRHAGPKLAPDLKQRNQIGQNLHCPAYR